MLSQKLDDHKYFIGFLTESSLHQFPQFIPLTNRSQIGVIKEIIYNLIEGNINLALHQVIELKSVKKLLFKINYWKRLKTIKKRLLKNIPAIRKVCHVIFIFLLEAMIS